MPQNNDFVPAKVTSLYQIKGRLSNDAITKRS
nr:MAG TPA: hypothetical protein [Caudoviricetes sp.]DAM77403.1 MAG TPA: hypothetical protein [Caudoviricetes sp.]